MSSDAARNKRESSFIDLNRPIIPFDEFAATLPGGRNAGYRLHHSGVITIRKMAGMSIVTPEDVRRVLFDLPALPRNPAKARGPKVAVD
jgi:hypothetical protein